MHLFIDEKHTETVTMGAITITSTADREHKVQEVVIDRCGTSRIVLRGDEIKAMADLMSACASNFSMSFYVKRINADTEAQREAERAAAKAAAS